MRTFSIGLVFGCGMIGLGFQRCDAISIDARTCGVAVLDAPDPATKQLWARIAQSVRAQCLQQPKDTPK